MNQLSVAQALNLEYKGMPVSSDCIESLFGVTKEHGTGEINDAYRMALRVPVFCGEVTREDAVGVLNISVKEQQKIEGAFSSLEQQRRQVLPNPGCLEKIDSGEQAQKLELILSPKKWGKKQENIVFLPVYSETTDPEKIHTAPVIQTYEEKILCA